MTIESYFSDSQFKPQLVKRWERLVVNADSPDSATTQLLYELLLQVRMIKLVVVWVLVIIPAAALTLVILLAVIAAGQDPDPTF